MKKGILLVALLLIVLCLSTGCAPGDARWDPQKNPDSRAGFITGIWHGIIIVITFIISFFKESVGIYEVNNTGWPYNLGFLIGLCFSVGAPWKWSCSGGKK